jgi:hypothetical protein
MMYEILPTEMTPSGLSLLLLPVPLSCVSPKSLHEAKRARTADTPAKTRTLIPLFRLDDNHFCANDLFFINNLLYKVSKCEPTPRPHVLEQPVSFA